MPTDLNVPRGSNSPTQSADEWAASKFGRPYPELIEVPELDPEATYEVTKAFYDQWGAVIRANTIAVALWKEETVQTQKDWALERAGREVDPFA